MAKSYVTFIDNSFVVGDSPVAHDVATALGRAGTQGFIDNFGTGDLTFSISSDGTSYGDEITLKKGDGFGFGGGIRMLDAVLPISKIRVTWVGDTSYKIFVN